MEKQTYDLTQANKTIAKYKIIAIGQDSQYFSWANCDICNSSLGGGRINTDVVHHNNEIDKNFLRSCVDCVQYIANGELPIDTEIV